MLTPDVDANGRTAIYMREQGCQHMPSNTQLEAASFMQDGMDVFLKPGCSHSNKALRKF